MATAKTTTEKIVVTIEDDEQTFEGKNVPEEKKC